MYRGFKIEKQWVRDLVVDSTITFKGFTSTNLNKDYALRQTKLLEEDKRIKWPVLLIFQLKGSQGYLNLTNYEENPSGPEEVILQDGLKFKIVSNEEAMEKWKDDQGGKCKKIVHVVTLEVLNNERSRLFCCM